MSNVRTRMMDDVRIIAETGVGYSFELLTPMTGKQFDEWRLRRWKLIKAFINSVDRTLMTAKHRKAQAKKRLERISKNQNRNISDYQPYSKMPTSYGSD